MNRWKRAAILCAIAAAMSNSLPVSAGLGNNSFVAETAAINVANHFPANMATGVSNETPLTVEFGGAVNQSFYQTVSLNLFSGTETINGELFYNPSARQVMFKARQALQAGQTYTAQLSYYDGLGRTAEKIWTFQTGEAGNPQALPTSSAATPDSGNQAEKNNLVLTNANMGSGSIRSDVPMEISFSQPIDILTLKSVPIQLIEDNRPIGIDYKLSRDMKTITISPRGSLRAGAAYAVALDRNLASTTGNRLLKKTLIPFRLAGSFEEPKVSQYEIEETAAPADSGNYENPFAQQNTVQAPARPQRNPSAPAPRMAQPAAEPVQVTGLAPQNGSRVTNLTQPVTIAFSEEIKAETLNEFTFRLEDDFGPVPARINYFQGRRQATLTPVGLLDSNKSYRVVVTQGITDMAGRPIRSGINAMFSTTSPVSAPAVPEMRAKAPAFAAPQKETAELENFESDYDSSMAQSAAPVRSSNGNNNYQNAERRNRARNDNMNVMSAQAPADRTVRTKPVQGRPAQNNLKAFKVTSIFPGAEANNIARKSKIAVHFSEAADPRTVNNINISMFGNQTRVDGKVIYDRQQNRAIFEPSAPLEAKTEYKVIVSDKIKSKMGEPLTQRVSWQFATTENASKQLRTSNKSVEADSAFFIPLVDSKIKKAPGQMASTQRASGNQGSFNFVHPKHWAFKSMRHVSNRGILNAFPFVYTDSVTRYEFASAINNALSNLKSMQHMAGKPKLRVADMIQLEQLIIEFRQELKSYSVNTIWFETFLQQQGVNLQQLEAKVRKMSNAS